MIELPSARLIEAVHELAVKARLLREQYGERLGEENTKASLISPLLAALGWDVGLPDEVQHEYRHKSQDTPVDYCLRILRIPKLLVEAKGLGEDLADHKWIRQTLGYATMAGAGWCVLTDGDEYRIYNATAAVDADGKLFCHIKLTESREEETVKVLNLISRSSVEKDVLSSSWKTHFVDQKVKGALRELVDSADRKLLLLVRRRTSDLSSKEIAASIRRLDIRIEALQSPYEPLAAKPPAQPTLPIPSERAPKQGKGGVSLADLIGAGILAPPLKLFRKYKGRTVEAELRPDGQVAFQGTAYPSCSLAGVVARASITGRRMNTNGWAFWQYTDANGKRRCLDDARNRLPKKGSGRQDQQDQQEQQEQPERHDLRKKFWAKLLGRSKMQGTRHADITPGPYSYIGAGSGIRGVPFNYVVGKGEGRVELYIDRGADQKDENKDILRKLHRHKDEIERTFGGALSWEPLEDKRACRVAYTLAIGGWRTEEAKWPAIHDAMIDAMGRLEKALAPHLEKLKTELAS
jgi:predicted type IV restriction endonuclease